MPDTDIRARSNGSRALLFGVVLLLLLGGGWGVWQSIWGFGGWYTHARDVPVPPNLIKDEISTPFTLDGSGKRWRLYEVDLLMEELIAFHHEQLPRAGWTITQEGFVRITGGEQAYCIIATQRGVPVYIFIRDGRYPLEPQPGDVAAVMVSTDRLEPPYCDNIIPE